MSALYPALLMAHCEHHYVSCLPREHISVDHMGVIWIVKQAVIGQDYIMHLSAQIGRSERLAGDSS